MSAIYAKDFKNSMRTMTGPIFIAFMLFWFGFCTVRTNLQYSVSQFEYTIGSAASLSLLPLPLLTMRTFAEERHTGGDKLLLTLPVKSVSIVLAKYLSALTVFAIPVGVVAIFPLILSKFGKVYLNTAYSSLVAYFFVGALLIALGIFISSLTESQVIAAIFSLGSIIALFFIDDFAADIPESSAASLIFLLVLGIIVSALAYYLTKSYLVSAIILGAASAASIIAYIVNKSAFEGLAAKWLGSLDVFGRMTPFLNGKFDVTSIIFYVSMSGLFLFLTNQSLEKRRWN